MRPLPTGSYQGALRLGFERAERMLGATLSRGPARADQKHIHRESAASIRAEFSQVPISG